eukprot:CAMPEP_0198124044 /NCGR_PEP_ID=MMETSP1442-20131203/38983_1 /TAXON_ID= /ORGANISM="Craspedostauros australis, Strain CCMP3328" /LENGTH=180 /DNA_ID=CAMNT_0043783363 /DNA_START=71 /DNA_END=610 /DNA_ORIENTATION=-
MRCSTPPVEISAAEDRTPRRDDCPALTDVLELLPSEAAKHVGAVPHDGGMKVGVVLLHAAHDVLVSAAPRQVLVEDTGAQLHFDAAALLLLLKFLLHQVQDLQARRCPLLVMMQHLLLAADLDLRVPFVGEGRVHRSDPQVRDILLQFGRISRQRHGYYLVQMLQCRTFVADADGVAHIA